MNLPNHGPMRATPSEESWMVDRLRKSSLYRLYRQAFQDATGLPLTLISTGPASSVPDHQPFCRHLNETTKRCSHCLAAHRELRTSAHASGEAVTKTCFAALTNTVVPVRMGSKPIAFLETGQEMLTPPEENTLGRLQALCQDMRFSPSEFSALMSAYLATPVYELERYQAAVVLLRIFARQLSDELNRILLQTDGVEPRIVTQAKDYIWAHLEENVRLADVAANGHVSIYYFCRLFKATVGMTFTEYLGRQRVELAKRLLLESRLPVTQIAYDVGFQSLSQFNRSFLRYAGESPTCYRHDARRTEATA